MAGRRARAGCHLHDDDHYHPHHHGPATGDHSDGDSSDNGSAVEPESYQHTSNKGRSSSRGGGVALLPPFPPDSRDSPASPASSASPDASSACGRSADTKPCLVLSANVLHTVHTISRTPPAFKVQVTPIQGRRPRPRAPRGLADLSPPCTPVLRRACIKRRS